VSLPTINRSGDASSAEQTMPSDADVARLRGALGDQDGRRRPCSRPPEIGIVIGREHGEREKLQLRPDFRLDGGAHGLRKRHARSESSRPCARCFDATRDSAADVVQLHVEEHALAGAGQRRRQRQSMLRTPADSRSCRIPRCRPGARSAPRPHEPTADRERRFSRSRGFSSAGLLMRTHAPVRPAAAPLPSAGPLSAPL